MNLFAGDDGPNNSKHLSITNVKHPDFDEKVAEHHPGGAIGAIEVGGMGFAALTLTFKIAGPDPQTMAMFGLGAAATKPWTVYGLARDKNGNKPIEERAVCFGRLSKLARTDYKRGDMIEQDHEIKEITHYEYYFNKQEIYYYDFFTSTWRVNGVDQKAVENAILRIA